MDFVRRDFLRLGSWGVLGASLDAMGPVRGPRSCILLWQGGGCSHLDTFDLKPDAPREIRGEFRAIATSVPGIRICEHLPLTARQIHRLTILRSLCSEETNHERAAAVLLPADAVTVRNAPEARRLIEAGARYVVLSQGERRYDTHAHHFRNLRESVLPEFDRTFAGLLQDLAGRGLLETTLVVAAGEFGRSPRINRDGGRDHHAGAWSVVLAGGGIPGGRVIGATDRYGAEVIDRPVSPAKLRQCIHAMVESGRVPGLLA